MMEAMDEKEDATAVSDATAASNATATSNASATSNVTAASNVSAASNTTEEGEELPPKVRGHENAGLKLRQTEKRR